VKCKCNRESEREREWEWKRRKGKSKCNWNRKRNRRCCRRKRKRKTRNTRAIGCLVRNWCINTSLLVAFVVHLCWDVIWWCPFSFGHVRWDVICWYSYAYGLNLFVYVYICMWFEPNFVSWCCQNLFLSNSCCQNLILSNSCFHFGWYAAEFK
jgi:hypothetical protein